MCYLRNINHFRTPWKNSYMYVLVDNAEWVLLPHSLLHLVFFSLLFKCFVYLPVYCSSFVFFF